MAVPLIPPSAAARGSTAEDQGRGLRIERRGLAPCKPDQRRSRCEGEQEEAAPVRLLARAAVEPVTTGQRRQGCPHDFAPLRRSAPFRDFAGVEMRRSMRPHLGRSSDTCAGNHPIGLSIIDRTPLVRAARSHRFRRSSVEWHNPGSSKRIGRRSPHGEVAPVHDPFSGIVLPL